MKKLSDPVAGLAQATGIALYISLIALVFWRGNEWIPAKNYLGPVLFLTLFSTSVIICGLIVFWYPVTLFWDEKKTKKALRVVGFTTAWLVVFFFIVLSLVLLFNR